jgi:glucose-6-phosphate 1-dehydrogenase
VLDRLVIVGAGGDLAGRFLLPALASLHAAGRLPATFRVVGADVHDWDDDAFRAHVQERLEHHALSAPIISRGAILASLRYVRADAADATAVAGMLDAAGDAPLAAYLALPQGGFAPAVRALAAAGMPAGSRIAVEKPFGEDLRGAVELNELLAAATGSAYRVDHVLGMPATQDAAGLDPAGADEVEVLWEETLALEGRAGFYDRAGALRDVLQNHMLQLLATVVSPGDRAVALRAVRVADPLRSRRARYAGYAEEEGVDPARGTETFAEVLLEVDLPAWRGTRVRLRAGKGLAQGYKGVIVHRGGGDERVEVDRLGEGEPPAYARVLEELLDGGCALSVRAGEAEEAWRIVTPVLDAWASGRVPLEEYPLGSPGPPRL